MNNFSLFSLPYWPSIAIAIAFFVFVDFLLVNIGKIILKKIAKKNEGFAILYPTVFAAYKALIFLFAVYIFLHSVLGISASGLLAGIGVSGLTIGVGAQGYIKDLFAGATILVRQNFKLGDYITVKNLVSGNIEKITLQYTKLRGDDGTAHFINNSEMTIVSKKAD